MSEITTMEWITLGIALLALLLHFVDWLRKKIWRKETKADDAEAAKDARSWDDWVRADNRRWEERRDMLKQERDNEWDSQKVEILNKIAEGPRLDHRLKSVDASLEVVYDELFSAVHKWSYGRIYDKGLTTSREIGDNVSDAVVKIRKVSKGNIRPKVVTLLDEIDKLNGEMFDTYAVGIDNLGSRSAVGGDEDYDTKESTARVNFNQAKYELIDLVVSLRSELEQDLKPDTNE